MADGRKYTVKMRAGKDGTHYLLIREVPPVPSRTARQSLSALAERLTTLKVGFQKAFRFALRRA